MNLLDIVGRDEHPQPWVEVSKIPWDDPAFSARMLREHLSQDHDAASRRTTIIERQVDWIHHQLLAGEPSQILDLGCGPGLYCTLLAGLGHHCTGIDFSPASIDYARTAAAEQSLDCEFILGDLRESPFGSGRDLVMLLFGELNVFQPAEALSILTRARQSLSPGGRIILEVHTLESIRARGDAGQTWSARAKGLFSDRPYIRLDDSTWNEDSQTAVERHFVIDAGSGDVTLYGTTTQAYTTRGYEDLLREAGFSTIEWRDDWPNADPNREFRLAAAVG